MRNLYTIHTGSTGNSYVLSDNENNQLLLDCGVPAEMIKRAFNFNFEKLNGVLVSHSHKDHCMSADVLENTYCLDVWRPYLVDGCRDQRTFGKWAVQSFDLPHDGVYNCGFLINHIDGFKMLYLTDLEYCRYTFTKQNVNAILIEANWEERFVNSEQAQFRHKVLGHLSLEHCIDFLKVNKTDALQNVIICHMSNYTLDVKEAIKRIRREVGIENVYAAEKEKVIEL